MEVSGLIFNQPTCFSYSGSCRESKSSSFSAAAAKICLFRGRRSLVLEFHDNIHLQFYSEKSTCNSVRNPVCMAAVRDEKSTKEKGPLRKKKHMKFLRSLSRDLSTFSQMGFGLDLDPDHELLHRVQGGTISEANELLLKQLQKLKADKDLKRQRKEEKKRQVKNRVMAGEMSSSSSSSSESSDSECGEVVDMNDLRMSKKRQDPINPVIEVAEIPVKTEDKAQIELCPPVSAGLSSLVASCPGKLEVCMGGKCTKSGAAALLEEFQKVVGVEGAVSGCKCMGKCRDGPNVRVTSSSAERNPPPLCIGVGLEDVNMIVANFLGENTNQIRLAPSC